MIIFLFFLKFVILISVGIKNFITNRTKLSLDCPLLSIELISTLAKNPNMAFLRNDFLKIFDDLLTMT